MKRLIPARRFYLAALLLAGLLFLGGCGGEFWGGVGDWEPGELGALPAKTHENYGHVSQGVPGG
ncbi:MAG: hypothetical protein KQI62_14105 [Deltaproteobacteria bacterium]|nr:hypothetical protein [Deltaproteobacteria bacterium]